MKLHKKACPFCFYHKAKAYVCEPFVYIECTLCKTRGPRFEFENEMEDNFTLQEAYEFAIQRWNYRKWESSDADY